MSSGVCKSDWVSRFILNCRCSAHSEEMKTWVHRIWVQEEYKCCFYSLTSSLCPDSPSCHWAHTLLPGSRPFNPVSVFQAWSITFLVVLVLISGTGFAHWIDIWLNFKIGRPRNFSLHWRSPSWVHICTMWSCKLWSTPSKISNPMRNQDHPWFGLYQWVEQVTTIPLAVTHHSWNETAFQNWMLRRKHVGVYTMTQEIKHSEDFFLLYFSQSWMWQKFEL